MGQWKAFGSMYQCRVSLSCHASLLYHFESIHCCIINVHVFIFIDVIHHYDFCFSIFTNSCIVDKFFLIEMQVRMAHSKYRLTHLECLERVCFVCFEKGSRESMRLMTDAHHDQINMFLIEGYDPSDDRLRKAICGTSRIALSEYSQGNFKRKIDVFDHSSEKRDLRTPCKMASDIRLNHFAID